MIADEDRLAIARETARLVLEELTTAGAITPRPRAVLTLDEAVAYSGKGSRSAFQRWNAKHGPCDCGHGRYSRERLDRALDREARR